MIVADTFSDFGTVMLAVFGIGWVAIGLLWAILNRGL